jgi:hypothetical protein
MNLESAIQQLDHQSQAIAQLVQVIDIEQARWRPDAEAWSMLEVIGHLVDEEREDFRARVKQILEGTEFSPIHPGAWVTERGYNQRELAPMLQEFLSEREASLAWLKTLTDANIDWDKLYIDPERPIPAGEMLSSWVAHDLLHLRQLIELRYLYFQQQAKPYNIEYAGEWVVTEDE